MEKWTLSIKGGGVSFGENVDLCTIPYAYGAFGPSGGGGGALRAWYYQYYTTCILILVVTTITVLVLVGPLLVHLAITIGPTTVLGL